ncbi:putative membrane protein [Wickerhamomyces ciferrii]|uniref:Protein BTN n=1 Tax=Wickerhamomyces ciferrii (strain ATCC 14091 / BCRC 22168 / CBS 111 / JCM 3599 / NBRC 0793 / NRRL Y-1031 F-60-10) TaxID=1206466 RepID=K0KYB0_WICCF|nr:uncharacterized protein BN7_5671 [Wickerhamomyces ciferrii]CCH46083.1 putative membrane protein [Wickerhamomyces ciferrii]
MAIDRVYSSFWLFGLLNNVLYVVILSAAVDLVGPLIPKATVLLADILPAFLIKISAPFFIHLIPYPKRIASLIVLSVIGMLLVTFGSLGLKILGIILASLSSGLGEITFLQLTHFYGETGLNGWSSGTGGAGLIGSGIYMLLTTVIGISVQSSLLLFSIFPFGFLYYYKLPAVHNYQPVETPPSSSPSTEQLETQPTSISTKFDLQRHITNTIGKLKKLIIPFMIPLSTVYLAEYLINQSVAPTLLFPLEEMPFKAFRDVYVAYGTLYQLGVFISRSSATFIRIRNLYIPTILQSINLVVLVLQSLYYYIPNVYLIMLIVFYEGLLGGAAYVNTFMLVIDTVPEKDREFSLGATSMSDSGGIVISALIGLWLEPNLCNYQVDHGREWCKLH